MAPPPDPRAPSEAAGDRLDSWKDIAAYLKRDVSTVQRWEKREGMPVRRHLHHKLGSVYAFRAELDAWSLSRSSGVGPKDDGEAAPAVEGLEGTGNAPSAGTSTARPRVHRWLLAGLAMAAGAIVAIGTGLWLLDRAGHFWRNPLAHARFLRVTDFDGVEQAAAVSRDGKFIAFLSDRDGSMDVWVTQVGTGQFHNLTRGSIRELANPSLRTISFSADATHVFFWVRETAASNVSRISVWTVPTMGGRSRPYMEDVAEMDWSDDGRRLVFHTPGPGDPMFVKDGDQAERRPIFRAPSGLHSHFPVWSPDGDFIYFVLGSMPGATDIWRIRPAGSTPERITVHNSQVSYPTFLDRRTLLYLATGTGSEDSRRALYALDVDRRVPRRISSGVEQYTSLAASADGRRLAVTVTNPRGTLWRVPIRDEVAGPSAASRVSLPTARGVSPRLGANYLLFVSSKGGGEGIWKLADGAATELWSAPEARVVGGPAIERSGGRITFVSEEQGRTRLLVMDEDGRNVRALAESLDIRGAPAWAPDGESITVAAYQDGVPRLMSVSLDARTTRPLLSEHSIDPTWSPDGRFLAYSGPDVGTTFAVKAVSADGRPYPVPDLTLTRGARRFVFLRGGRSLVVLRGEIEHKDFWLVDLDTRTERQLTNFGRAFLIRDFDVSPDGGEIVFDHVQENSDIVLIDRLRAG
jgi:Tol biopolymer transport system component